MAITRATAGKTRLEITLIPVPQAAEIARVFVRHQLISLGYADLIDDACVIVSEMVANAVVAVLATGDRATRESIRLRLGPNDGHPLVEVWDSSPEMPVMRELDHLAESGRGLHIIQSLAARFGWCPDEERGGKTIWALLT
jgi:anti-sigma regulatory factor (Ser/Thr protein kinase)